MNSRHIVLVAPPWYPVPPHGYGGIELVVHLLARGLRDRGHTVTLLAAAGSAPSALDLAPAGWVVDLGGPGERCRELVYASRVVAAVDALGHVDVVHDHVGFGTLVALLSAGRAPVVHTVHGPILGAEADLLREVGPRAGLIAVSDSQRRRASSLDWIGTVHNAVDVSNLLVGRRGDKEPYLLCLARICHEKGQHLAVEVARRLEMRLVLAGKVETTVAGAEYFRSRIAPFIDDERVVYINNVAGESKARLLARATALLAPVQWDEPFGLALVEAMASGTPAISMGRGAAPEVITEGVTGFVVEDVDGMVDAVRRVGEIDLVRCAAHAREQFSPEAMADGYLRAYETARGRAGGVAGHAASRSGLTPAGPSTAAGREPLRAGR